MDLHNKALVPMNFINIDPGFTIHNTSQITKETFDILCTTGLYFLAHGDSGIYRCYFLPALDYGDSAVTKNHYGTQIINHELGLYYIYKHMTQDLYYIVSS